MYWSIANTVIFLKLLDFDILKRLLNFFKLINLCFCQLFLIFSLSALMYSVKSYENIKNGEIEMAIKR